MGKKKTVAKHSHKRIPIYFSIHNIEILENVYQIPAGFNNTDLSKFNFKITFTFSADLKKSIVNVKVLYAFIFENIVLNSLLVANEYVVTDLTTHLTGKKITEPIFARRLADLSLNHTRGIHSTLITKTVLEGLYIPIVSLDNIDGGELY